MHENLPTAESLHHEGDKLLLTIPGWGGFF